MVLQLTSGAAINH